MTSSASKPKRAPGKRAKLPTVIGWRERISLPDLGLTEIGAKLDTGARTTALHATSIRTFARGDDMWVSFHPEHAGIGPTDTCQAQVRDIRAITNTGGVPEDRIIIQTHLHIAGHRILIDLALADRADMKFPIIIGRSAMRRSRLLVDSGRSWLTHPEKGIKT